MGSASSSPTGSTATKLLRSGHSRRSVSTEDPGGLIEGLRRHGPPQGRLIWLPEQSAAARASAPSCSSMKSPASYGRLMAKRACPAAALWPLPRPWKREGRRRGKGARQRQKPSAPLPGRAARPVKRRPSAAAPSPCRAQLRPISPHPCRHQIPRGCRASGAVFSLQRSRRRVGRRRRTAGLRGQNGCMRDGIGVLPARYAWIVP